MIYSDGKPYYSLNNAYRQKFGRKAVKISLDAGFTCPNRDGTLGTRGCIFCSQKGSGDFTAKGSSIIEHIAYGKNQKKWQGQFPCYIAYFQAFTNTYAPVTVLKKCYEQAICCDDVVGISIATRPDCLGEDVLNLLSEINEKIDVCVELGLQTIKQSSIELIRRGYQNDVFEKAVLELSKRNIEIVVHIILGLPHESKKDMIDTIKYINHFPVNGVKLQLLYVLSDSDLAQYYKQGNFETLCLESYVDIVCDCIEYMRPDIVIHRLTGDGDAENLIAPLWSKNKRLVLNTIHKTLKQRNAFQGKKYIK